MTKRFGIVEAASRARAWMPQLRTPGERLVLSGLVVHTGRDSMANPSIGMDARRGVDAQPGQLMTYTGMSARAIRRVLTELDARGVIAPTEDRTGGRGKTTRWVILDPTGTRTGESAFRNDKPGHETPKTRTRDDTNPDTAMSATESSEITEGDSCSKHEFVAAGPDGRFKVCELCGVNEKSVA